MNREGDFIKTFGNDVIQGAEKGKFSLTILQIKEVNDSFMIRTVKGWHKIRPKSNPYPMADKPKTDEYQIEIPKKVEKKLVNGRKTRSID